jgi:uncharacterized membrane protein YdjX (TVP38/TMEM64 family)
MAKYQFRNIMILYILMGIVVLGLTVTFMHSTLGTILGSALTYLNFRAAYKAFNRMKLL